MRSEEKVQDINGLKYYNMLIGIFQRFIETNGAKLEKRYIGPNDNNNFFGELKAKIEIGNEAFVDHIKFSQDPIYNCIIINRMFFKLMRMSGIINYKHEKT